MQLMNVKQMHLFYAYNVFTKYTVAWYLFSHKW